MKNKKTKNIKLPDISNDGKENVYKDDFEETCIDDYYPSNHRIRNKNMNLMEAALIGMEYLKEQPNFEDMVVTKKDGMDF